MKQDANHGTIALHDALEGYDFDTAIYCLVTQLARWITDTAKDRDDAERLLADASDLLSEGVATTMDVLDLSERAHSPRVRTRTQ